MKKKQSDFIKCSLCSFWRTIRIYDRYIYLTNPFRISQFQSGISNLHDGCFLITIRNVEVYTFIHVLLNIQVTCFTIFQDLLHHYSYQHYSYFEKVYFHRCHVLHLKYEEINLTLSINLYYLKGNGDITVILQCKNRSGG